MYYTTSGSVIRTMRLAVHKARVGETRNMYKISVVESKGNRLFTILSNTEMELKSSCIEYSYEYWIRRG